MKYVVLYLKHGRLGAVSSGFRCLRHPQSVHAVAVLYCLLAIQSLNYDLKKGHSAFKRRKEQKERQH